MPGTSPATCEADKAIEAATITGRATLNAAKTTAHANLKVAGVGLIGVLITAVVALNKNDPRAQAAAPVATPPGVIAELAQVCSDRRRSLRAAPGGEKVGYVDPGEVFVQERREPDWTLGHVQGREQARGWIMTTYLGC